MQDCSTYPTMEQIKAANREQICRWYRFLRSPEDVEETLLLLEIVERFNKMGGMTPEISKKIGWE